ncbi:unnamed protein product [Caenorhabditis bovis]|uniref:Cdc23 domain-containing protein n=1 Tax=Caenorhabditis bovis TaxID=2654633 RepID=A0A8S1ETE0_9PELO|nr:unnamed protein product [Caenorhabditis bovis]
MEDDLNTPVPSNRNNQSDRLTLIQQAAARSGLASMAGPGHLRHTKLSPFDVSQMSGVSISMIERAKIDGAQFIKELVWLRKEANSHSFLDAELWANELLAYCPEKLSMYAELKCDMEDGNISSTSLGAPAGFVSSEEAVVEFRREQNTQFALSLLRNREFQRAAFFLAKNRKLNKLDNFMYYRCLFLAHYQENMENDAEGIERKTSFGEEKTKFATLYEEMNEDNAREKDDPLFEYLLGLIEIELGLKKDACETMKSVVEREPRWWPAWEALSRLIDDIEAADQFAVKFSDKSIWMADWFMVLILERFHQDTMAIQKAESLVQRGLTGIPMIITKVATCSNHRHDHDQAIENFEEIRKLDPYRLADLNLFSDSLYIRGDQKKLSQLALEVYKVYKFRWETCCIVGNYHAIRRDSEHSIKFFQRALRLNPGVASLWVLIGHEFMEMKNNAAACVSYRRAIEIDSADYRGWYGLGQMYDIMKMPSYSLYYYQQAQKCKPHDSRLLVALGEIYCKLSRIEDAEKCFTGAYLFGDVEGSALWQLAKLYENNNDDDKAAQTFEVYLVVYDRLTNLEDNAVYAIAFLANYFFRQKKYEKASEYATKCLEYEAICQEGNRLFREIAKVQQQENAPQQPPGVESMETEVANLDTSREDDMAISDGEDNITF